MPKIDVENQLAKKQHVDGGGSRKYFVRKPYPVECKGYIKVTKTKTSSDYHTLRMFTPVSDISLGRIYSSWYCLVYPYIDRPI